MTTATIVWTVVGIIVWVLCLVFNIMLNRRKNRIHPAAWVVCSVFFTIITLIVNLIVPARKKE